MSTIRDLQDLPDASNDEAGSSRTLPEQLLADLQERIVDGDLTPGSRLAESELASHYGVSRGPLREAIRRLEAKRLVEAVPRTGARVVALTPERLQSLYHTREALEGMAARLAATAMSEGAIDELTALLQAHSESIDEDAGRSYRQAEGDVDFHYRIARGSGNELLARMLCDELYQLVRLYRRRYPARDSRPMQALREHQAIVAAIGERDGDLAEYLMRRHISRAREAARLAYPEPTEHTLTDPEENRR